jgi:geranylgeranyl pyrophosphate synthase
MADAVELDGAHAPTPDDGGASAVWNIAARLGLQDEIKRVDDFIAEWLKTAHEEVRGMMRYQLSGQAKAYRPATVFACYRAATGERASEQLIRATVALELFHNFTLVIDDIVDRDDERRGQTALHTRFGFLPSVMTCGYLVAGGSELIADDAFVSHEFADLGKRLAVAECRQWRLRGRLFGIDQWRGLAGEDTGVMFEKCARIATRNETLARYGYLVGTLYHGCDDVADVRGSVALGTDSDRDVKDRILTLPAAIATRDPDTAELFEQSGEEADEELAERLAEVLPEAEAVLDGIAEEAREEARSNVAHPEVLLELIDVTRALSKA